MHLYFSKNFYYLLLIFVLLSCNQKNQESNAVGIHTSDSQMCYQPVESLKGQNSLEKKYLNNIKAIQPKDNLPGTKNMVFIEGGQFEMGGDQIDGFENLPVTALAQADEFPKHMVSVSSFYMDEHEVTIGQYLEFVNATGYKTVAEHDVDWEELKKQLPVGTPKPDESTLKAGSLVFHFADPSVSKDNLANWWTFVQGANWKQPEGKRINIKEYLNYPVTQISWYDAMAYAKWVDKRLPTEAEFEYAMRGGADNTMYPWGNEVLKPAVFKGNFLQGDFPYSNTGEDGFVTLAPVKSFEPNNYGLYDIAGNVWEWTNDWYGANYYEELKGNHTVAVDPQGPEKSYEVYNPNATNKVVRGGSFLCNDSWCSGYRNSRRMRLSPDTGMQHLGFRLVRNNAE